MIRHVLHLIRSQRGAKSGSESASVSAGKALIGRFGTLAINCGTGILTARALRPEGRGELAAMILWPVFLSGAFTLGMSSAMIFMIKSGRRPTPALVSAGMLIALLLSIVTSVLGILLLPHWLVHYPANIVRAAQWFMLSTPCTMIFLVGRSVWEAQGKFGTSSASLLLSPLLTLLLLIVLTGAHQLTPVRAAACYVVCGIPPILWVTASVWHSLQFNLRELLLASRDLLSYGLRSYGIDLCGSLAQYVDQAMVLGMLAPFEMGTYTVALSLSRMINVVFASTATVVFPKAMDMDGIGSSRLAVRAVTASLVVALPSSFVLVFGSALALRVLYGPEYAIATGLLRVLLLEAIVSGCVSVLSQPFMALGRPGTVTILQAAGLATSVPLIWLFAPHWGSEGAGFALLCSAFLRLLLLRYCYRSILPARVGLLELSLIEARHMFTRYIYLVRRVMTRSAEEAA